MPDTTPVRGSAAHRYIAYYAWLLSAQRVHRQRDPPRRLLTPGGFQIYLRTRQAGRARGINDIGVEEIIWSVDSEEELQRIEQRLRTWYPSTYSNTLNGVSFVGGVDPDGIRVLITYPTPEQFPSEVIDRRFR